MLGLITGANRGLGLELVRLGLAQEILYSLHAGILTENR